LFTINVLIESVPITVKYHVIVPPAIGKYKGASEAVAAYEALRAYEADIEDVESPAT
jgi:hypothetical protein